MDGEEFNDCVHCLKKYVLIQTMTLFGELGKTGRQIMTLFGEVGKTGRQTMTLFGKLGKTGHQINNLSVK